MKTFQFSFSIGSSFKKVNKNHLNTQEKWLRTDQQPAAFERSSIRTTMDPIVRRVSPRLIHHLADDIDGLGLFARHREMLVDETRNDAFAGGDELLKLSSAVLEHLHRPRLA